MNHLELDLTDEEVSVIITALTDCLGNITYTDHFIEVAQSAGDKIVYAFEHQ